MKFIAYTVKGLEQIATKEIENNIVDSKIEELGDKFVVFTAYIQNVNLDRLKTIDDIGVVVLKLEKPKKLSTQELIEKITGLDLTETIAQIKKFRNLDNTFSLTLSLNGLRIKKLELQNELVAKLIQKYGWKFVEKDHSNFDIRLFLNRKIGFVSIKLAKEPLHKRKYKEYSSMGSLKPTVAAAMVMLATDTISHDHSECNEESKKLVDTFCGSGTILAEALNFGFRVYGGDIEPTNVVNTHKNLTNLDFKTKVNIKLQDAIKTIWPSIYFDFAVSNLPWDKQVGVESITNLYINSLKEYQRILKPDASLCLLIHKPQILIKYAKKYFPNHKIQSTKISFTGQSPTIVLIKMP